MIFFAERIAIVLVLRIKETRLPPELSRPLRFRIQGGSPERYERRLRTEILVCNIGLLHQKEV